MKKTIIFMTLFTFFFLTNTNQTKSIHAFSNSTNDDHNYYDVTINDATFYTPASGEGRLFKHSHNDIYVYQLYDRVNYLESGYEVLIQKTSDPQKTVRLNMRVEGYYFENDFFILWGKKRIGLQYDYVFYKYSNDLTQLEELYLTNVEYASFNDVVKIGELFYFCGGASGNNANFVQYNRGKTLNQSDAVVLIMDASLTINDMWFYGGTNHERFTNIDSDENRIILVGEKSSIGSGDFENIGQVDQEKVILVSINMQGDIEESIYFDHDAVHEFSSQLVVKDGFAYIHIYVEDYETHYLYKVELNGLEIQWGQFIEDVTGMYLAVTHMAIGNHNTLVIAGTDSLGQITIAGLHMLDGDFLGYVSIQSSFMSSSIIVNDGLLHLYGDDVQVINNKTEFFPKEILIDHYSIDKNVEKICSTISCSLEDVDHVSVSTWFGYPTFVSRMIQANFSPSIHGTYDVSYRYALPSQKTIDIESSIRVPFYANVIEDGVYGVGFKAVFTGMGLLNNEPFISGKSINQPGNYQLIINNYNQEVTTINFRIENGILYSGDQNTIWNIACEKGDILEVKVSIYNPDGLDILNLYINDTIYPYYEISQNKEELIIDIVAPMISGIHHVNISKIEYDYHGELRSLIIDATAIINVLKTTPTVQLIEENSTNKMIQLKALFSDVDQAIINIKSILYENDVPIRSKEIQLTNSDFDFEQLKTNTSYKATILISYNLGDNIRHVVEMVEIRFTTLKEHISLGSITVTKKGIILEEAIIQFSQTNTNLLLSSVKINGKELVSSQPSANDYTIYYVISGGSIAIMITSYFIVKSRKKIQAK